MTVYLNGGSLYTGVEFETGTDLLNLLLTNLGLEGWDVVTNDIASNDLLVMRGVTENGHNCYIRFSFSGNQFEIRGDLTGDGSTVSDPLALEFDVQPGNVNRAWLTYESDSAGLIIKGNRLYKGAMSWGFYDRVDETRGFDWHIGLSDNNLNNGIVARHPGDNAPFVRIGSRYDSSDQFSSINLNGPLQGIVDYLAVENPFISFFNTNVRNAGYSAQRGSVNKSDDLPILTKRFYLPGRSSITDYASNNGLPPVLGGFQGFVKHFTNGFGSSVGGRKEESTDGALWLSSGDSSRGWQALQVDQFLPEASTQPLTAFRNNISFLVNDNFRAEASAALQAVGWTPISETSTRSLFSCTHSDGITKFFLRIEADATTGQIKLQGSIDETESRLSSAYFLPYTEGSSNLSFETINSDSGVICVRNASDLVFQGVWFGFFKSPLARYGIGYTTGNISESETYDTRLARWRKLSEAFTFSYSQVSSFPTNGLDRLTVSATPVRYYDYEGTPTNSAIFAYKGQINPIRNKAELSFYGAVEGDVSTLNYGLVAEGENVAPRVEYLGTIQNLVTGMASVKGGDVVTSDSGIQYMSTSDLGQGMRISQ